MFCHFCSWSVATNPIFSRPHGRDQTHSFAVREQETFVEVTQDEDTDRSQGAGRAQFRGLSNRVVGHLRLIPRDKPTCCPDFRRL